MGRDQQTGRWELDLSLGMKIEAGKIHLSVPTESTLVDDGMCFGCGRNNPGGLNLNFLWDGDTCITRFVAETRLQGWAGRVHGGILALVLDEVMSRVALERHGRIWVTADLSTRYLRPAPIGQMLVATARVELLRRSLIVCTADVALEASCEILAVGRAKMMRAK